MTVAGTAGHRPNKLGGYGAATVARLRRLAAFELTNQHVTRVISGMALGWDQAVARAAVDLGIPFVAAVPFKGQESAWPDGSQAEYRELLKKAESVIYVSPPPYTARKMQVRNEFVCEESDIITALWDSSDGGTANCLRYARLIAHKPIVNAWDRWVAMCEAEKDS